MDHKTWLWNKRFTEKTTVAAEKLNLSLLGNEGDVSSALSERNTKDEYAKVQAKLTQEDFSGLGNAEAEAISLKQEQGKALQQIVSGQERIFHLDGALKECTQQLHFVREEQETRIHNAVMTTTSRESEKTRIVLEEKLTATGKRLARLGAENTELSKALLAKGNVTEYLNKQRAQAESELDAQMAGLESKEKENSSLKYEVRVLEKELEVQNEEREFTRRTADVSHKQHLESVKKIANLESECQRPRLVQKWLPGPAALAKMKIEVDKVHCADASASALMSELEHFRNGKQMGTSSYKTIGASDINLMDDFDVKEKLAVVSADEPCGNSHVASEDNAAPDGPLQNQVVEHSLEAAGESLDTESLNHPDASNSPHASGYISWKPRDKPSLMDSPDREAGEHTSSAKKSNQQIQSNLSKSIRKTIELIGGISLPSPDYRIKDTLTGKDGIFPSFENSETPTGYTARVFQWKTSELAAVLQQFVQTCNDLLNGKADLERFSKELTSALEWIVNHCFSLRDVSSMRDAIKKHFDWDESISESEAEGGMRSQLEELQPEARDESRRLKNELANTKSAKKDLEGRLQSETDKSESLTIRLQESEKTIGNLQKDVETMNQANAMIEQQKKNHKLKLREESRRLRNELEKMESAKKDLEGRLQSETDKSEALMIQLQESEKTIERLQKDVESMKQSKIMIEEQIGNHKMEKEDLDRQLTEARVELNEAQQKFSTLEMEMENKINYCEELESTSLDLQLQLESVTKRDIPKSDIEQEENQLQTDWEITEVSAKLAQCQETIHNLGKQLKALASPRDATLFDRFISVPIYTFTTTTTPSKNINERSSSLLNKLLAEDDFEGEDLMVSETKEVICDSNPPTFLVSNSNRIKTQENEAGGNSLVAVPIGKKGGGLMKNLLWKRKNVHNWKTPEAYSPRTYK
ncbi:unnamed protein product [Ilex paraguariensis]|uniref:Filament-like plant protein 7 n=1 Tax=Ilex paraguariensis TaxID=185542 RepID=A0ABC8TCL7_9AQUA